MLTRKINKIKSVISEQLGRSKKPMVSISWGKDSFLLFHLIHEIAPCVDIVFLNSGYGISDNYKFRDLVLSEYNPNYIELNQEIDYIDFCRSNKLPHHRTHAQQKKAIRVLKKDQLDKFAVKNNYDLIFWGLRSDESKGRFNLSKNGYYFDKLNGLRFCHPLIYMSQFELWYIYESLNLPVNNIYKNVNSSVSKESVRNSGWLSTDGENYGRIDWIRDFYPEEYSKLLFYFPEAKYQTV